VDGFETTNATLVDLHTHTTASDGSLTPDELVAKAASLGIRVLGITDHDTTDGVAAALAAATRWQITVVPGVEISTLAGREELHLLGYFIDPENADLQEALARSRRARRERAKKMVDRLGKLGLPVAWERVLALAGDASSIGRPHVASALLEAGYVGSWDEAFDLWIGRGCPAYVERYKLSPEEAIELVLRSGGLPVLAHPFTYSPHGEKRSSLDLQHWLPRLRRAGLAGIEVYYPNYPRRAIRRLLDWAVRFRLLPTGGSDFHGDGAHNGLGSVVVPWAVWQGLLQRHL